VFANVCKGRFAFTDHMTTPTGAVLATAAASSRGLALYLFVSFWHLAENILQREEISCGSSEPLLLLQPEDWLALCHSVLQRMQREEISRGSL
jgi:hypothetical protein